VTSLMLMKGLASVELFLTLLSFLLLLHWITNFLNVYSRENLGAEALATAKWVSVMANRACQSQAKTTVQMPCTYLRSQLVPYQVSSQGSVITVKVMEYNASQETACTFDSLISGVVECAEGPPVSKPLACFYYQNGKATLSSGACT
jgi:hypothetical protein